MEKGIEFANLQSMDLQLRQPKFCSALLSQQSWTKHHLLQLQVTEQALQSASSSNNLQQQLPSMTAVQICANNKICSSISFRLHFLKHADEYDLLCATLAEVKTAGSASLYSAGIDQ